MLKRETGKNPYTTRINPIRGRNNQAIITQARKFSRQWRKQASGKKAKRWPHVKPKTLKDGEGKKRKVFLSRWEEHLKKKRARDIARRMKLLPCVRELLENTAEVPKKQGNDYRFTGKTPGGELFRIIVREEKGKLYLLTFYPARAG